MSPKLSLVTSALLLAACTAPALNGSPRPESLRPAVSAEPAARPFELIVEAHDGRLEAVAARRLGARVLDRLTIAGHRYLLLGLEPERLRAQPYEGVDPRDAAALTRAAADDLSRHHGEMLASVDFNTLAQQDGDIQPLAAEPAAPLPGTGASDPTAKIRPGFGLQQAAGGTQPTPTPSPGFFNDLSFGIGSGLEGWWRTETKVEGAWSYSIGTGVTAAYLDAGFVTGHPELARRMVLNGQNNQTSEFFEKQPGNIELPKGDHGTASLLVGFAERENHLPSVGVAPNARFVPYVAVTIWDVARGLLTASRLGPDVIGMNFAFPIYPGWEPLGLYRQYHLLREVLREIAATTRQPIVMPAHNYGEPVSGGPRDWVPVAWQNDFDNIIGVGGVQVSNGLKLKAWFNPDLLTGINARGSNYGEGLIWAPSTLLDIASAYPNNPLPASMNGTSASCPFMTAAVSLLRSRLPQLSAKALRDLLLATARPVDAYELTQRPGASVPMVQLEAALLKGLRDSGQDPARYRARRFSGRFELAADGKRRFIASDGSAYLVLPTLASLLPGVPSPFDGRSLSLEGWTGIPPLAAGELEVLRILEDLE